MSRVGLLVVCAIFGSAVNLWAGQAAALSPALPTSRQDPAEFTGPPKPIQPKPSAVLMRFAQGEVLRQADKQKPETIKRALDALDGFVQEAPNEPYIRWMRAGVLCEMGAPPKQVLDDLVAAHAQLTTPAARQFVHVQSVLAENGRLRRRHLRTSPRRSSRC